MDKQWKENKLLAFDKLVKNWNKIVKCYDFKFLWAHYVKYYENF